MYFFCGAINKNKQGEKPIVIYDWYSLGLRLAGFNSYFTDLKLVSAEKARQIGIALPLDLEPEQIPYIPIWGHQEGDGGVGGHARPGTEHRECLACKNKAIAALDVGFGTSRMLCWISYVQYM